MRLYIDKRLSNGIFRFRQCFRQQDAFSEDEVFPGCGQNGNLMALCQSYSFSTNAQRIGRS